MSCKSSVHCRAHHSEVVLLFHHVLAESLHGRLLLASLGVNNITFIFFGGGSSALSLLSSRDALRWDGVRTTFFLGQPEVDQVDEVRLRGVVAYDDVCGLQISMDIALRM